MKLGRAIAVLAALTALGGCNKLGVGAGNGGATANAATNATGGKDGGGAPAAVADAAAPTGAGLGGKDSAGTATQASAGSGGTALDRAYVTGRWTDKGDCSDGIEFSPDGRFVTADGGSGLWNLEGDELTMSGSGTITLRIVPVDHDTMTVVNRDGSLGRSTRC